MHKARIRRRTRQRYGQDAEAVDARLFVQKLCLKSFNGELVTDSMNLRPNKAQQRSVKEWLRQADSTGAGDGAVKRAIEHPMLLSHGALHYAQSAAPEVA